MAKLINKLHEIVSEAVEQSDIPEGDDFLSGNLTSDFGLDSLDVINILFEIEEVIGVRISEEDIEKYDLLTVSRLIDYLEKNTKK